jgi:5-methylthioadenosine/S-adenosylhomocysteine deaminase
MSARPGISRRGVLGGAAALGAAGLGDAVHAEPAGATTADRLPHRGEFVVRGAHVMSMDPAIGDLDDGDVHVREAQQSLTALLERAGTSTT